MPSEPISSAPEILDQIQTLRDEIVHHEQLYYVLDAPVLSDAQYDALMNRLKALEAEHPEHITPDSPTQRVGGKPKEGFPKVPHSRPMLSLDNVTSEEELRDWDRRVHQLAGDLLDKPTRPQRLATAFNRLHRMTNEGGSVAEEWRMEGVADRVRTFGTAFLGLTLECARCQHHP